jgi:uncharacterized repeat protein (TIGR02543 family)
MKYRLMSLVSIIFGTMLLISFAADLVVFYDSLVIFDTMGAAEIEPLKVESGDTVSLPTPQREGYTFEGWFLDDAFESSASFLILSNQDRTLYAKWDPIPYTLVFNTNGGSSVDSITDFYDEVLDITLPEKVGYNFSGWFEDDQTFLVPFTSQTMTLDKTLYAKWTAKTFNVTYALDGSENNVDNVLTYTIEDDLVNFLAPSKVGYTFLGWYEDSAFTGNAIFGSDSFNFNALKVTDASHFGIQVDVAISPEKTGYNYDDTVKVLGLVDQLDPYIVTDF